jgi:S-methylmethionine-dependent homocysteine/selenocysteine methylase
MGTDLARRGVDIRLPLWSANALLHAPDVVRQIHADYIDAGAQVITANTFRTNVRTLARAGLQDRMRELTHRAVTLARQAVMASGRAGLKIAGSMAPVEDCYSPELVPHDESVLFDEHSQLAHDLAAAGCDLLLIETMNTVREAAAAMHAAYVIGLPVWVSVMPGPDNRLLSGESLDEAVRAILPFGPQALLVNCLPVAQVSAALSVLRHAVGARADITIGAYANAGHVEDAGWSIEHGVSPRDYAGAAAHWRALGATIIGGCCGTTPDHIRALTTSLSLR